MGAKPIVHEPFGGHFIAKTEVTLKVGKAHFWMFLWDVNRDDEHVSQ